MVTPPMRTLPASIVTRLVPQPDTTPIVHPEQGVLSWESQDPGPPMAGESGSRPDTDTDVAAADAAALRGWATRFAQAVVEAVAGHRPPSQLVRWTTRTVYRDVERRTRLAQRAATAASGIPVQRSAVRPQVRSVHVCAVGSGAAEVSVHVQYGRRSRAIAMRLEVSQGRWVCTAMEFA